jgi:thioredoxin reductase (NADPH)
MENVVIIGSGPAGLTAALYAARARLAPVVIAGNQLGGQVSITTEVENYPGLHEDITGPDLVERFRLHAEKFGARVVMDEVTAVDFSTRPLRVVTNGAEYLARAVILAVGASPRRLGVPGEEEYIGRGVSYCATCDGFFFRDRDIVVVGGGDSAIEEGLFLTRFGRTVRVVHRRDQLRAGATLQRRAFNNDKMDFIWDTVVEEIGGNGSVNRVRLRNLKTGEQSDLATAAVFVYIGHYPNSALFKDQVDMDSHGYVLVDEIMQTSVRGVFAAGEIMDPVYRQVVTSAGQGCQAAMKAEQYLAALEAG